MTPKTAEPKKTHRPVEDRVAELEQKIASIKARAASKQAKANPVGKALLVAVKAIDKALGVAAETKDDGLARALEASRAPLSEQVVAMGIRLPDAKARKGGRRKKGEAA
mgnify:CR=1 FL=1